MGLASAVRFFALTGSLNLTNVSFAGNASAIAGGTDSDGRGGALFIYKTATASLVNTSFSGSVAANAGTNTHIGYDYNGDLEGPQLQCPRYGHRRCLRLAPGTGCRQWRFRTPVALAATAFQYAPATSPAVGWTFAPQTSAGGSGVSQNGSGFTNLNDNAPEGAQVGLLQGTGSVSQTIIGFQPGVSYQMRFSMANRGGYNPQTVQVVIQDLFDNGITVLGTYPLTANAHYQSYTTSNFVLHGSTCLLTISGTVAKTGGVDATAFIDNVTIVPVTSIVNGGFELPTQTANGFTYDPSTSAGVGWTFSPATSGVSQNGSGFTGLNANAPEWNSGWDFCNPRSARSRRWFRAFQPDTQYQLAFQAAGRKGYGPQTVAVTFTET